MANTLQNLKILIKYYFNKVAGRECAIESLNNNSSPHENDQIIAKMKKMTKLFEEIRFVLASYWCLE